MFRVFLIVVGLMLAGPVFAQNNTVNLDGLSPSERADIISRVNRANEEAIRQGNTASSKIDPVQVSRQARSEMEAWGMLGQGAGKAVVSAAKELGMAANEFAETGLGKLIIVLVVIKFVGKSLLAVGFGIAILTLGYWAAHRLIRPVRDVKYAMVPTLFGAFSRRRRTEINYRNATEAETVMGWALVLGTTLIGGLAIFVW